MTETRIASTSVGDIVQEDYSVPTAITDAGAGQSEFRYTNPDWAQQLGYYKKIPEIASVIDATATWTVGKGFQANVETKTILNLSSGIGKDTFNELLKNMIRTMEIGGDAFAEIMRDDDGDVINLKPLDPSSIVTISNKQGLIERYEQISKVKGKKPKEYPAHKIFHLIRNRVADEVHGQTIISVLEEIILMKNEAMSDYKTVMHRFVVPQWKFKLKTDDPAEIAAYKAKMDATVGTGANIYEPFDTSESELVSVPPNSTLDPKAWIELLDAKFYEAAKTPKIVVGGTGGFTEQAVTITYLAFQQSTEDRQLYIEEQVKYQLGYEIELEFPATVENNLLSDKKKDGPTNIDAAETTAGMGG